MLAGIIRGPNRFSPFRSFDRALLERDDVLDAIAADAGFEAFLNQNRAAAGTASDVFDCDGVLHASAGSNAGGVHALGVLVVPGTTIYASGAP